MKSGKSRKGTVVGMVASALLMAGSLAYASSVTLPNTFSSGSAAVAAEVNANFNAVAAGVNDNDGRVTTNASAIAALEARIAALESSGGLTTASLKGTYRIFSLDNGTGQHQQDDGSGIYHAQDDDVITSLNSVTFDGAGNFSGMIVNGGDLHRVTNQNGDPTYSVGNGTGIVLAGTYSVSGGVITFHYTSPEVFTKTAYGTVDGNVFIAHELALDSGTGWEYYSTVISVGVRIAQ